MKIEKNNLSIRCLNKISRSFNASRRFSKFSWRCFNWSRRVWRFSSIVKTWKDLFKRFKFNSKRLFLDGWWKFLEKFSSKSMEKKKNRTHERVDIVDQFTRCTIDLIKMKNARTHFNEWMIINWQKCWRAAEKSSKTRKRRWSTSKESLRLTWTANTVLDDEVPLTEKLVVVWSQ